MFEFTTWRTIQLGTHASNAELRQALTDMGYDLSPEGSDILDRTSATREPFELDLVRASVKDLGFPQGANRVEIYERALSLGLELCPAEAGPQLRLQYPDQPKDEAIRIAMEPIVGSDPAKSRTAPYVFNVVNCPDRHRSDKKWLDGVYGHPGSYWYGAHEWVFCRK